MHESPIRAGHSRRQFLVLSGGGLAAVGLTGCAGLTNSGSQSTAGGIEIISLTGSANPKLQPGDAAIAAKFQQDNPGVHVVLRPFDDNTVNSLQAISAKLASGSLENIIILPIDSAYIPAGKGQIAEISEPLKKWKYYDQLNPSLISGVGTDRTKHYVIPYQSSYLGINYSRKMFAAAGLDPDKPPTTWAQFEEYARKLSKPDQGIYGYATLQGIDGAFLWLPWLYSAGGRVEGQNADGTWRSTVNEPAFLSALELFHRMRFKDQSMMPRLLSNFNDAKQAMAAGRLAMYPGAPTFIVDAGSANNQYGLKPDDLGTGPMPQNGGNTILFTATAQAFSPKQSAEQLRAAVDYALFSTLDPRAIELSLENKKNSSIGIVPFDVAELTLSPGSQLRQEITDLTQKYSNIPAHVISGYVGGMNNMQLVGEPALNSQQCYQAIGPAVESALTDERSDLPGWVAKVHSQIETIVKS